MLSEFISDSIQNGVLCFVLFSHDMNYVSAFLLDITAPTSSGIVFELVFLLSPKVITHVNHLTTRLLLPKW